MPLPGAGDGSGSGRYVDAMRLALELAESTSVVTGRQVDVPVGAIVLDGAGNVIGSGANVRERDNDPTGHAEIVAIRGAAARLGTWRLDGCTLVVTLEPCTMCAGAVVQSRLDTARLRRVRRQGGRGGLIVGCGQGPPPQPPAPCRRRSARGRGG